MYLLAVRLGYVDEQTVSPSLKLREHFKAIERICEIP